MFGREKSCFPLPVPTLKIKLLAHTWRQKRSVNRTLFEWQMFRTANNGEATVHVRKMPKLSKPVTPGRVVDHFECNATREGVFLDFGRHVNDNENHDS